MGDDVMTNTRISAHDRFMIGANMVMGVAGGYWGYRAGAGVRNSFGVRGGTVEARYGSAQQRQALLNRVREAGTVKEAKGVVYAFRAMKRLGFELQDVSLKYKGNQGLDLIFSDGARHAVVEAKHGASLNSLTTDINGLRQGTLAYNVDRLRKYLKYGDGTHNKLANQLIAEGQTGQLESFATLYRSGRAFELPAGWPTIPAVKR